jgi:hypothetical protein
VSSVFEAEGERCRVDFAFCLEVRQSAKRNPKHKRWAYHLEKPFEFLA